MLLKKYQSLDKNLIKEIEDFLIVGDSVLNPLFSSPMWAIRLKKIIKFEYTYLIVRDSNKIIALKLIFDGYRGYQKIDKLHPFFIDITRNISKLIFGYKVWFNPVVFLKNETDHNKNLIKDILYNQLSKYRSIYKSPVLEDDNKYFPRHKNFLWGTYIIKTSFNTYEKIFLDFKRNAQRALKKTNNIKIKEIDNTSLNEYLNWLKDNQFITGKSNLINIETFRYDLENLNKENYIYKIFVAYEEKKILGSISIWGFNNFISERGVYRSYYSKINGYYEQDILKDWIIKFSLKNNISFFDLAGFNPNKNISKKENSIKKFKEKFGGKKYLYQNINS